jgi:hypothetical protein
MAIYRLVFRRLGKLKLGQISCPKQQWSQGSKKNKGKKTFIYLSFLFEEFNINFRTESINSVVEYKYIYINLFITIVSN